MKKGFSLLEVLVTLGILALLFAVLLPNFSYVQKKKEEMKVQEMTTNLLRARRLALESYLPVRVQFGENSYGIYQKSACLLEEDYKDLLSLGSYKKEEVIHFTEKGRPDGSAKTLVFHGKKKTYHIIVAPVTGQVRWEVADEKGI